MAYEIWATAPGNLLATFDTRGEALAAVRAAPCAHGREYVADLALAYENRRGQTRMLAAGDELIRLAEEERELPAAARPS